jgi:glycosyltransferase involved in cell wall biosynthesis
MNNLSCNGDTYNGEKIVSKDTLIAERDISIVLATFNGERFLEEQLDSLFKQTVLPRELIINDDCSTDRTHEIVASFTKNAPFPVYTYINNSRLGYTRNFFRAACLASGSYIAFCDQDDIWSLDKIERLLDASNRYSQEIDLVLHTSKVFSSEDQKETQVFPSHLRKKALFYPSSLNPWLIVPGHCMIASRELIDAAILLHALLPNRSFVGFGHDQLLYFLAAIAGNILVVPIPLVRWRQHSSNTSGVPNLKPSTSAHVKHPTHTQLMIDLSNRWSTLSVSIHQLAYQVGDRYSPRLLKLANLFKHRSKYFYFRALLVDNRSSLRQKLIALFRAHVCYVYASGLRCHFAKAFLRDVALIPVMTFRMYNY